MKNENGFVAIAILCLIIITVLYIWFLTGIVLYKSSFKKEDVNCDGKVDIHDLLIVQKYIIKENEKWIN